MGFEMTSRVGGPGLAATAFGFVETFSRGGHPCPKQCVRVPAGGNQMAYYRNAAVAYARTHWDTSCHDGRVSLIGAPAINIEQQRIRHGVPASWVPKFVPDG